MKKVKFLLGFIGVSIAGIIAVRGLLFTGPVVNPGVLPTEKILDMHVHAAGIGAGGSGCYISESLKSSFKFDYYLRAFFVTREELHQQGDRLVIAKLAKTLTGSARVGEAIVLALDGVVGRNGQLDLARTEIYIPNEYVAKETAKYDNLYFGASINPYRSDAIPRLVRAKQQGAKLLKWIPSIQMIDPADRRIVPFYKKLIELDLPLLTHTGQERSFSGAQDSLADPLKLELPLELGVTVIAAHIATTGKNDGQDNMERILPLFDKYPNLYADISSLTQVNKLGYLNRALPDPRLKGRLLYGSDYPLINTILVSPYYFPLNLKVKQMRSIAAIDNLWDRDVALKHALGMPGEIFARSKQLLLD